MRSSDHTCKALVRASDYMCFSLLLLFFSIYYPFLLFILVKASDRTCKDLVRESEQTCKALGDSMFHCLLSVYMFHFLL